MVYNFKLFSANKYMLKVSKSNSKVWNLLKLIIKAPKRRQRHRYDLWQTGFYPSISFYSRFPQRFSFFTVYLIYYLLEVPPRWPPKVEFLRFTSPDCWKMHFRQFLWLRKHNLHIVEKYDFFREYYDLVIDLHEIASH